MKWLEKLTGLDKIKQEAQEKIREADERIEQADKKTLTDKEKATRKKQPWVGVIDTHVNQNNVRNGFFELDWNQYFVDQLRDQGYGFDGDSEEDIVDRWFRELCANVVVDGDLGGAINTGMLDIDAVKRDN